MAVIERAAARVARPRPTRGARRVRHRHLCRISSRISKSDSPLSPPASQHCARPARETLSRSSCLTTRASATAVVGWATQTAAASVRRVRGGCRRRSRFGDAVPDRRNRPQVGEHRAQVRRAHARHRLPRHRRQDRPTDAEMFTRGECGDELSLGPAADTGRWIRGQVGGVGDAQGPAKAVLVAAPLQTHGPPAGGAGSITNASG